MATQTVKIEIELEAELSADVSRTDIDNVDYRDGTVVILGHRVDVAILPKALRDDILALLGDAAYDDNWEDGE